ncbi:uracil-xanthine permease family protein [Corynebacterium variabile]|uniref:uracil-xanthine permease family protein n=2 Tax=Corynebacterium variabile TaxID=1727 RepID=UPI00264A28E9|nr:nucleobase:cation symporter-2 family protein [Corynebacterium variabile]MDN6478240.1 purine permease [Corynebacterium variabile]
MTATMPASGPTTDTSTRQTAPTSDASFSSDGSAVDRNLGWRQNLVFGIQHVLMMYVGCVSVPLTIGAALGLDQATVAMLVNADLLVAGVITLIQSLGAGRFAGARMPVVGGAAFAQVATMISISNTYGLPAIWGCMLAGGVIGLALAWPFSKLLKYFPPLVTGAVLLVLGISLIGVPGGLILGDEGTDSYARPRYIGIAAIVVVIAFGLSALARGMVAKASLLIAAVAGVLLCWPAGLLDFSGVGDEPLFAMVTPFHFGSPEFPVVGVISMTVVMMFLFSETIASVGALSEITGKKLSGDALSGVLGGIFNGFYDTVFTQNVGAIKTTRVHSRYVTATSGLILLLMGFMPVTGAVIAALPDPVVGGVSIMLFTSIASVGVSTLRKADLGDTINSLILSAAVAVGLLSEFSGDIWSKFPDWAQTLLSDGVVLAALAAFFLNLLFNHTRIAEKARASRHESQPEETPLFL